MVRRPLFFLLLAALPLGGCAEVLPWLINPQGAAVATANAAVTSLTQTDVGALAADPVGDIDRILRENPDAVNAGDLRDLRGEVAGMPNRTYSQADLATERRAEHDRRVQPPVGDRRDDLVLATAAQYQLPRGLRSTPLSHYDNDSLPRPDIQAPQMDGGLIRFGDR